MLLLALSLFRDLAIWLGHFEVVELEQGVDQVLHIPASVGVLRI
jgi:hypothetical protein